MSGGGGRGGRTPLLLALINWPLTTHPFRDGAPFLFLLERPIFGRSVSAFLSYVTYAVLSLSHPSPLRGELLKTTPDVSQGFQGGVFPTKNTNQLRGDGSGEA